MLKDKYQKLCKGLKKRTKKKEHKVFDLESLIKYFLQKKKKDFILILKYMKKINSLDVFGQIQQHRDDALVFDTTYNTNKFSIIFAPFVRVNHHGKATFCGCRFLNEDNTYYFIWLFNKWLDASPKGIFQMIINDQNLAVTKIIARVYSMTYHRYCIWHILNKLFVKINAIIVRDHYYLFQNAIFNSETIEEFNTSWSNVLQITNFKMIHGYVSYIKYVVNELLYI